VKVIQIKKIEAKLKNNGDQNCLSKILRQIKEEKRCPLEKPVYNKE